MRWKELNCQKNKAVACILFPRYDIHFLQCQFVKLRVSCDEYLSVHWSIMSHWKGFQQSLETSSDLIWTLEPLDFAEKSQNVESLCAFQASMSLYMQAIQMLEKRSDIHY